MVNPPIIDRQSDVFVTLDVLMYVGMTYAQWLHCSCQVCQNVQKDSFNVQLLRTLLQNLLQKTLGRAVNLAT